MTPAHKTSKVHQQVNQFHNNVFGLQKSKYPSTFYESIKGKLFFFFLYANSIAKCIILYNSTAQTENSTYFLFGWGFFFACFISSLKYARLLYFMAIFVFGQISSQTLLIPSAIATTDHVEGIWIEKKELKNCLGVVVATCKHTAAETITSEVCHQNSTHQHFILQHKAKPTVSAQDSGKATWTKQVSFGQYFTHLLLPTSSRCCIL